MNSMNTVLVTGGFGRIGAQLCKELIENGCHVLCIDTGSTETLQMYNLLENPRFKILNGDILNMPSFGVKLDYIFHMACVDDKYNNLDKMRVCFEGTRNVLNIAETHGSRVIVATDKHLHNVGFDVAEALVQKYTSIKGLHAGIIRV